MAATGWLNYCTYTHDVNFSLQQLRQTVFDRREFRLPGDLVDGTSARQSKSAPPTSDLQKLHQISRELDQALKGLGFDTTDSEKQTRDVGRLLEQVDKKGFVFAARETLESSSPPPATIHGLRGPGDTGRTQSALPRRPRPPPPR
ncbi:hypothetical protein, partial [Gimesia sp.]|uniref:hypothetical protein n=1 Tax=Gimesia sp. TaxID=2024833 RepID=UPI003A93D389